MKKISAILLIALFLFNMVGYKIVFNYVQQKSDRQLKASLDNQEYDESELLTLIIPTTLPYQNDMNTFERVDGEISYQGKIYKYVKRKMVEGQLILLCLPDHNKMRLQYAKADFLKNTGDVVQNNASKKSDHSKNLVSKNIISDYISSVNDFAAAAFDVSQVHFNGLQFFLLPFAPHLSPEQPPDHLG